MTPDEKCNFIHGYTITIKIGINAYSKKEALAQVEPMKHIMPLEVVKIE